MAKLIWSKRRVAAIFVKDRRDHEYTRLTYLAKEMFIDDDILQPIIVDKVNMHELASDFPIPRKASVDGQIKT